MIREGDIVRAKIEGRSYLARVVTVREDVRCEFISRAPSINGSRRKEHSFSRSCFHEYGRSGVDHILQMNTR
jgi:hypothetical protein